MQATALILACLLLAACGSQGDAARNHSDDYVRQFNALYNSRQLAYDKAFQALGSTTPSDASPNQLRTLFDALAYADFAFVEGIGQITSSGNIDTLCQSGSFNWKIGFPVNDCPDVAALWRAGSSLASDEKAIADVDIQLNMGADKKTADISKVSDELDQWRAAANRVRQDIGLPAQSFEVVGWCIVAATC